MAVNRARRVQRLACFKLQRLSCVALLSSVTLCLTSLAPATASGQPTQQQGADRPRSVHAHVVELVTQSAAHYEAGRFAEAIELLEQALQLKQDPTIQYNLARAKEGRGDLAGAAAAYAAYLALAPEAEDRGAIQQRVLTLKRQIEERAALERSASAAGSDNAARQPDVAPPDPPASRPPSWAPWVLAGVGATALVVGAVFGLRSQSAQQSAVDAEYASDAAAFNDDAKRYALVANVGWIFGASLTLGGLSWGLVSLASAGDPSTPSAPDASRTTRPVRAAGAVWRSLASPGVGLRGEF